eukprot:COSAG01_NODE_73043_length_251_cov_0.684211_1_plen_56_part_01
MVSFVGGAALPGLATVALLVATPGNIGAACAAAPSAANDGLLLRTGVDHPHGSVAL